ncbi:MAG TPA: prenyltransferase [Rubrobacteraceae bacterium]|jgi:1,4-dihydroxy-2-naphthoate octaprenyltransferase|nr:prenyltransferase [Rubrobacteraceae bacterium]
MNVAMWGKALGLIPRLNKEEWSGLDFVSRWLIATRAAVLVITLISAGIAGLLAVKEGSFDFLLWALVTLGLLMAHATNNLLNDLTDHLKGADSGDSFRTQYGVQPVEAGLMSMREVLLYAAGTGLVALAAGAYLFYLRGLPVLVLLAVGAFFVLFYTWPLKYVGLGEIAVLVVWGPLMIGGGYYTITGGWSWEVVLAGLPYALGTTAIIFGKHIDKLDADRRKGIRTLPVLLGEKTARHTVLGMMVLQYPLVLYLVLTGFFTPVMLVVSLSLYGFFKLTVPVYRSSKPAEMPKEYRADVWPLWYVAFAFLHNRRFGALFALGLAMEVVIQLIR